MPDRQEHDRQEHAGWTVLLLLVVVLAAGCGGGGAGRAPEPEASPKERASVDPAPLAGTTGLQCGQQFRPPAGGGLLALSGRFPATVPAGEPAVTGLVEVTSRVSVRGVVAPRAEVFLVRDGRVATVPVAQDAMGVRWDLAPGRVERLPGEATLVSCAPGGGSVRPGIYQLYARVVFTADDGAGVASFGGPWPLEVR
jgi:hypothetical protein